MAFPFHLALALFQQSLYFYRMSTWHLKLIYILGTKSSTTRVSPPMKTKDHRERCPIQSNKSFTNLNNPKTIQSQMILPTSSLPYILAVIINLNGVEHQNNKFNNQLDEQSQQRRQELAEYGEQINLGESRVRVSRFYSSNLNQIRSLFNCFIEKNYMHQPVSLLKKDLSQNTGFKKNCPYKVYVQDNDGTIYSTKLQSDISTVHDVILEAVKKFNHNLGAGLVLNANYYELYIAKNGRKNSGLPSLDKTQSIDDIGKHRFFLTCLKKQSRMSSLHSLESVKAIQMDFDKKAKTKESEKDKGYFCLCGGW